MKRLTGEPITPAMRDAGNRMATDLIDACIYINMQDVTVARSPLEDAQYPDIVKEYLEGRIDSVEAIYRAMRMSAPKDGG